MTTEIEGAETLRGGVRMRIQLRRFGERLEKFETMQEALLL